jgi:hypothetical protein
MKAKIPIYLHEVDTFTTFARIAGAAIPQNKPIDGLEKRLNALPTSMLIRFLSRQL